MAHGGNRPWKAFFDDHPTNKLEARSFDDCTIADRYDCEAGEEWKERLSATVEGREYDAGDAARKRKAATQAQAQRRKLQLQQQGGGGEGIGVAVGAGAGGSAGGSRSQTPLGRATASALLPSGGRSGSPSLGTSSLNPSSSSVNSNGNGDGSKKVQNEAYFARKGSENAARPEGLPPNQGGKYAGFGSVPAGGGRPEDGRTREAGGDVMDEFQKDPVAALTKGLGWLGGVVGQGAKTGFEGWVKPGMQKVGLFYLSTYLSIDDRIFFSLLR